MAIPEEKPPIPDTMPVMVLQGATLFPHGLLPLCIFEHRYRDMLVHALQTDRMFCIGNVLPGVDPETHPDPVHHLTTAGLIRACVTHDNGTSHLMLAGMQRVEIVGWEELEPFRIARVVPQPCFQEDEEEVSEIALEVIDLCELLTRESDIGVSSDLSGHLRGIKCPATISDVVAQNFVTDSVLRQQLLETLDVRKRLEFLVPCLSMMISGGGK